MLKRDASTDDAHPMGELTGVRWTRFGKDRLYVKDADGGDVGWIDLLTGQTLLNMPERAADVAALAAEHGVLHAPSDQAQPMTSPEPTPPASDPESTPAEMLLSPPTPVPPVSRPQPSPPPTVVEVELVADWYDLALNRPGQAARAKAEEELAAMKQKTRVGTWLARTLDVKTDERAWRVGADGEETIGAKLEKLTKDGWYLLHSVPVGKRGSDIDHVVIGPAGVFTVNTKKHPGKKVWVSKTTILVDGHRTDYLRNSRFEGERATKLLSAAASFPVFVKPVLIFTTGTLIPDVTIKSRPDDVVILDRMDVPRAFKRSAILMTGEQVEQVHAVARRSATWLP
jgi:hypothetical protein